MLWCSVLAVGVLSESLIHIVFAHASIKVINELKIDGDAHRNSDAIQFVYQFPFFRTPNTAAPLATVLSDPLAHANSTGFDRFSAMAVAL